MANEISKAQRYLNSMLDAAKATRAKKGETIDDQRIETALQYRDALKTINQGEATAAQARLIAMWYLYRHVEFVGEYNKFSEFIEQEILINPDADVDKIRRSVNVVENLLQWIHANGPIYNGNRISVDDVLAMDGLSGKLNIAVGMFQRVDDRTKHSLLHTVLTDTQDEVREHLKAIRKALAKDTLNDSSNVSDDTGQGSVSDPLNEDDDEDYGYATPVVIIRKVLLPNDRVRFEFDDSIDLSVAMTIEMLLEGIADIQTVSSAN